MIKSCGICKYAEDDGWKHTVQCRRNPLRVGVEKTYWCGEWKRADPVIGELKNRCTNCADYVCESGRKPYCVNPASGWKYHGEDTISCQRWRETDFTWRLNNAPTSSLLHEVYNEAYRMKNTNNTLMDFYSGLDKIMAIIQRLMNRRTLDD